MPHYADGHNEKLICFAIVFLAPCVGAPCHRSLFPKTFHYMALVLVLSYTKQQHKSAPPTPHLYFVLRPRRQPESDRCLVLFTIPLKCGAGRTRRGTAFRASLFHNQAGVSSRGILRPGSATYRGRNTGKRPADGGHNGVLMRPLRMSEVVC